MDWKKTLVKVAIAAGFAAVSLLLTELTGRVEWWAIAAIALLTAAKDYLKHRNDPVPLD